MNELISCRMNIIIMVNDCDYLIAEGKIRNFEKSVWCIWCLKLNVDGAITVVSGKEFQAGMTRLAKKNFLAFSLARGMEILSG